MKMKKFFGVLLFLGVFSLTNLALAGEHVRDLKDDYEEENIELFLQGYDSLSSGQGPVEVRAKVEIDTSFPVRPDLEGVNVGFFHRGEKIGEGVSDDDGMVKVRHDFFEKGKHRIQIRVLEGDYELESFLNLETTANVYVWGSEEPIFISDIDHTVSDNSFWDVLFSDIDQQEPFPYAANTLTRLNRDFRVVYLTARDDAFFRLSREWLQFHGFPQGPLFVWDFSLLQRVPWNHGEYKERVIEKIKESFNAVMIGVGDRPHDIEAYLNEGLKAYLMRSSSNADDQADPRAVEVRSWKEIAQDVLK